VSTQGLPFWSEARVALLAFAGSLALYVGTGSPLMETYDTAPNAYLPVSVLLDGDLAFGPLEVPFMFVWAAERPGGKKVLVDVQRWEQGVPGTDMSVRTFFERGLLQFMGPRYFLVETRRERAETGEPLYASAFGPMAGLMALPAVSVAFIAGADLGDRAVVYGAAKWTAALLIAGSVALVFLTAAGFLGRWRAFALAMIYGLGSCVWALSSQALWQQTPELFFLSLGACCLVRANATWVGAMVAGLAFAAAAACRPTAALVGISAIGYLLTMAERRHLFVFLLAAAPIGLGLVAYNFYYFGTPLNFGQLAAGALVAKAKTGSDELWQTPLWLGAAGLLVSPSRGLLVYTPWLAAAFVGGFLAWKDAQYAKLRFLTLAVPTLWLPAFIWFDWWGGWAYGYRPIVDSAPLLAILSIPVIDYLFARPVWCMAFAAAVGWSVFVQILGVTVYQPSAWNAAVIDPRGTLGDIDQLAHRHRLWSFRDWQIGFLIGELAERGGAKR